MLINPMLKRLVCWKISLSDQKQLMSLEKMCSF